MEFRTIFYNFFRENFSNRYVTKANGEFFKPNSLVKVELKMNIKNILERRLGARLSSLDSELVLWTVAYYEPSLIWNNPTMYHPLYEACTMKRCYYERCTMNRMAPPLHGPLNKLEVDAWPSECLKNVTIGVSILSHVKILLFASSASLISSHLAWPPLTISVSRISDEIGPYEGRLKSNYMKQIRMTKNGRLYILVILPLLHN